MKNSQDNSKDLTYLNHIQNGALVLDSELNVRFWNSWLEIHSDFQSSEITGRPLTDFFPSLNAKKLRRKISTCLALNSSVFYKSEVESYLIKLPLKRMISTVYEYMMQDAVITVLDADAGEVLVMIYDQTQFMETKAKLEASYSELEKSERSLQNLLDFQANIIFVYEEGRITTANKSFLEFTASSDIEDFYMTHEDISDIFIQGEGLLKEVEDKRMWFDALVNQQGWPHVSIKDKHNAKKHTFIVSHRLMPDEDSKYIIALTDISRVEDSREHLANANTMLGEMFSEKDSQLRQANMELESRNRLLKLSQKISNTGSIEWRFYDSSVRLSAQMVEILSPAEDETLDSLQVLYDKVQERSANQLQKRIEKCVEDGGQIEDTVILKDSGKILYVQGSILGTKGSRNHTLFLNCHDITGLQKLKEEAETKERMLASVFEFADIGLCLLSETGVFKRLNNKLCEITGFQERELLGQNIMKIVAEKNKTEVKNLFRLVSAGVKKVSAKEVTLTDYSYSDIHALSTMGLLNIGGDSLVVASFMDITDKILIEQEQKEQEQLLLQHSKMAAVGEMLGIIAHQWKQPLNVISILVQDLEDCIIEGDFTDEFVTEATERVMEQVMFMADTVEEFRSFFKPRNDKNTFSPVRGVQSTARILAAQFNRNAIKLDIRANGFESAAVQGNENDFKNVILNIFNNSIDAIRQNVKPGDGVITVDFSVKEGSVELKIHDNGGGVPDDILQKAFEQYFTTKGDEGTGVGLYLAKLVVEKNMGGRIYMQNTESGACTVITAPEVPV